VGGGAWPFLVGGVICLVNSDNERDLSLLISCINDNDYEGFGVKSSVGVSKPVAGGDALKNLFSFILCCFCSILTS
jgi:hypothetical protein